ncbi:MAG TPA: ABC transporter permease [Vicinamibacterales bacterium]|nr:ABC transporter permease [Vicinamibacterales bacterium]
MPDWSAFVRSRLAAEGEPSDRHADAIEELAQHLEDVYRAARAGGASEDTAAAAAAAELAGLAPIARALRRRARAEPLDAAARRRLWLTHLGGDVRQACRLFGRRPAVSSVVILTLAIGIGACTAVFSIFKAVLFDELPYPEPDRLVLLWEGSPDDPDSRYIVAAPVYEDWRRMSTTLESLGIWEFVTFNIAAANEPEQVAGVRASSSLFDVLGIRPVLGRTFRPDEDAPGHHVVVISEAVWRSQFGGDPDVIGRTLRLNDAPNEVIGVMPAGFVFPRGGTGLWVPIAFTPQDAARDAHSFFVAGRLKDGTSLEQARAEFKAIGRKLADTYTENRFESGVVTRMSEMGLQTVRRILIVLFGAVAFVLCIACVNVANLQMGQALVRRREFAVRMAIGAGTGRVARQLLIEGLALAALGGLAGLLLAWVGTRGVDALLGPQLLEFWFRGRANVRIDGSILAFAAAASTVSAMFFSLAPLAGLRRSGLQDALQEGVRGLSRSALGPHRALVTAEIALAILVLCAAGLLVRSLANLLHVDPGLDPADVLTMRVSLPQADTYGPAERAAFCEDLARSAAASSFAVVGAVSHLPLSGANAGRSFSIEGRPAPAPNEVASANYRVSCPGYFRALGIPIAGGRDFTIGDRQKGALTVIVNRAAADRYWPGEDAVGQRLKIGGFTSRSPWLTIVGVAGNVRHFGLDDRPGPEIFVPYGQAAWPVMTIVAKSRGSLTGSSARELRELLRRIDPALPPASIRTMADVVGLSVEWRQSFMRLLGVFAAISLAFAAVGIYGVLSYYVSQRRREIGIRMALGSTRSAVVRLVLGQMLLPAAIGVALGLAGSFWTSRLLADLLFEVRPGDIVVSGAIVAVLLAVGLAAGWVPARRAASIDPILALRGD